MTTTAKRFSWPVRLLYTVIVSLVLGLAAGLVPGWGGIWKAVLIGGLITFVWWEWKGRSLYG